MRARYPDREGYVTRDGVRIFHEVHGEGDPTVLLIPGWTLGSRSWKAQIPYLARHYRVLAFDPRGTGRSDRPVGKSAYSLDDHVADALAVLDATETDSVCVVGKSRGAMTAAALASRHARRTRGLVAAAPMIPLTRWPPIDSIWPVFEDERAWRRRLGAIAGVRRAASQLASSESLRRFARRIGPIEAQTRFSRQSMLDDFERFAHWFTTNLAVNDPHATKQAEDTIRWMLETEGEHAADAWMGECPREPASARALCERIGCPVLVIHGELDLAVPLEWGAALAELTGGELLRVPRAGHLPGARYPVKVNLALRGFIDSLPAAAEPATQEALA